MKRRPIVIKGDIAEITLAAGEIAIIDAVDADKVSNHNWAVTRSTNKYKATSFYVRTSIRTKNESRNLFIHRLISGAGKDEFVNHTNGNFLDNRKCNLELTYKTNKMKNGQVVTLANWTPQYAIE
jgi:predicted kinase